MKTPDFWHAPNLLAALLSPLSLPYRAGAWLDRTFTKTNRAPIPVISIGNVTAGGAGKTPATIALAKLLTAMGETPHILTRGYGGSTGKKPTRVTADSDWREVGDEALLLAAHAPTWAGSDRLLSAEFAAQHGATCVLADDALQHHALHKDISLLVMDGAYGLGNGYCLPAGPLREPLATAIKRCHATIMIGHDAHGLSAQLPLPLFQATLESVGDIASLQRDTWLAFAGLARPEKFFDSVRNLGASLSSTRAFADHYPYNEADIATLLSQAQALGARLVTTAKDAVKISPVQREKIMILDIAVRFANTASLQEFLAEGLRQART